MDNVKPRLDQLKEFLFWFEGQDISIVEFKKNIKDKVSHSPDLIIINESHKKIQRLKFLIYFLYFYLTLSWIISVLINI